MSSPEGCGAVAGAEEVVELSESGPTKPTTSLEATTSPAALPPAEHSPTSKLYRAS